MQQFKETQRFDQWWLRILFFVILIVALSPLFSEDIWPDNQVEIISVIISVVLIIAIFLIIYLLFKLTVIIDKTGVQYKFFPFHIKYRTLSWDKISAIDIVTYNPIKDFGGWGYRLTLRKKKALSVKGKIGIQIVLQDGNTLLLGTQRPKKAEEIINQFKNA